MSRVNAKLKHDPSSTGGVTIGATVSGGTPTYVLYIDSSGNLAMDSGLTYNDSTNTLTAGSFISNGTPSQITGANGEYLDFDSADLIVSSCGIEIGGTTSNITFANLEYINGDISNYILFSDVIAPITSDGAALGSTTYMWSDLFLASGGVINFNNGDVTITHSADLLTIAGGNLSLGTSAVFTTGTIELGAASDTTLSRSAAGVLAVEGVVIPSISSTNTLTNKRLTPRITTITSSATPTINTDDCDAVTITALAAAITSMTSNLSGTPTNFQRLTIRIKDDGTARAITWGASFEAKGVALPTTTVISKVLTVGFIYDTVSAKWGCVASAQEA